jgi:hypothetical protein
LKKQRRIIFLREGGGGGIPIKKNDKGKKERRRVSFLGAVLFPWVGRRRQRRTINWKKKMRDRVI